MLLAFVALSKSEKFHSFLTILLRLYLFWEHLCTDRTAGSMELVISSVE